MDELGPWKVRDGSKKDLKGILSLREMVFGEVERDKLEERFWRWEFEEGPEGQGFLYIAEDGERIIGHFADLPRRFSVQGKIVLGTLSLDLMVHPDYWRRGIFAAMGKYGAQRVKREQGLFMTAFPIRLETIQGLKKIGWKGVAKLPVLVYPIKFTGIVKRYLRFPPLSFLVGGVARLFYFILFGWRKKGKRNGVEVRKVNELDERFDLLWEKAISLHPIAGVRDRRYLTWRYLQHPTRTYEIYGAFEKEEIKGYIVLRKVDLLNFNSAVIVDLLALDEATLIALFEKGIQYSRQAGADLLGFMVPQNHLYYHIPRRRGFLPSFKTFLFMIYSHSDQEIFLSPEKWYVTWGDTDVI